MSATPINKTIDDTVKHLKDLKDAVISHRVHLTRRMTVGITEDSKKFANTDPDRHTIMDFEELALISDPEPHSLIIYESIVMKNVEFAVHDGYNSICLVLLTVDDVIPWMTPSSGDNPAELNQLLKLAETARQLMC